MLLRDLCRSVRQSLQLRFDVIEGVAQLQDESRVDGVLTRRAPVHEARRFLVIFANEFGELLYQRNCGIAGESCGTRERADIEEFRAAFRRDNRRDACLLYTSRCV